MTKEDKQIIKMATKENWRIGDRTRLKRLLEKNLEQYRENKTLEGCLLAEQEHTLMLENENRLLGERCNQLLKDKGELTDKIADIKANCDLAIEGRDIKIMELEEENERLKGDLELWESGGCRATNIFECGVVKELKEQIEKMKCCANCKSFKGYGETCEGWGEPVLNLNCDCTVWELKE